MDTKQTIAVLGSGSWGTAVAQVLSDNGHTVYLYGRNAAVVDEINRKHTHSKFFDDIALNPDLTAVHEIEIVKECKIIVLAVPTIAVESICQQIDPYLQDQCILVNLSKGFHPETNQRMSEVIRQSVSKNHLSSVVSLIGPSHAEEVVIRQLTTLAAVSLSSEDAKTVQRLFSNPYFRVYTGTDEVGSEIGAALKNVMAIASGILAGLGYRDNTRAALITRGLQEMIRFGMFFKGQPNTFVGLTGIGDLIVT
ncbi:MAG: NAD(P)-dependent glycerol-3-phosphate dehydrogenase, partial [Erysipelotrichaceae bacterium]|nr:NAD(P)-dependent glycerol-3-phosphate dehydrogenase [Erysipelotrichaceae bacterium]